MDVKLVISHGAQKNRVIRLRSEETIIGRQKGCDVRIPSPEVSRRHCRLSFRDGSLTIEDLASANGSFLNGVAVQDQETVSPGDQIQVGPIVFRVIYDKSAVGKPQPVQQPEPLVEIVEPTPTVSAGTDLPDEVTLAPLEDTRPRQRLEDDDEDEQTINLDELEWRAPPGTDFRDILSKLDDK